MPIPFSSKDHNKTNLVNIADSSTIINNTITSNDIADSSIINNNFANGSITSDKLSTALQNILVDFDDRLTALENAGGGAGWSGTITFTRTSGSGTQYIYVRTNTENIVSNQQYLGNNSVSVSLANAQSYVEIAFNWIGYWEIDTRGFSINVGGSSTNYFDDGLQWYRYSSIPPETTNQLTYNFTTFEND